MTVPPVGYVRAASYGHTVGGAVGLAMVDGHGEAITPAWLADANWTVEINGREFPATVSLRPLYDPTNGGSGCERGCSSRTRSPGRTRHGSVPRVSDSGRTPPERPSDPASWDRLREIVAELPDVTERISHGELTWFVGPGKRPKQFANTWDHHHDESNTVVMAAAAGVQERLIADEPELFFRPPYVGGRDGSASTSTPVTSTGTASSCTSETPTRSCTADPHPAPLNAVAAINADARADRCHDPRRERRDRRSSLRSGGRPGCRRVTRRGRPVSKR